MNVGIPTHLDGCLYRSRLEARWARFFGLLGWQYQYEPCDLSGWIPDFLILGRKHDTLAEVKPFSRGEEFDVERETICRAIEGTMPHRIVLLLGCTIFQRRETGEPQLGWFLDGDEAVFNRHGEWGFRAAWGSWRDCVTGEYDGNAHVVVPRWEDVWELWNQAGNDVQWNPGTRAA